VFVKFRGTPLQANVYVKFKDTPLQTNMSVELKMKLVIQIIWANQQEMLCIIIKLINSENNNKNHLCYIISNS
jgi:hypothetical protein